jgi:hypothetical protein
LGWLGNHLCAGHRRIRLAETCAEYLNRFRLEPPALEDGPSGPTMEPSRGTAIAYVWFPDWYVKNAGESVVVR